MGSVEVSTVKSAVVDWSLSVWRISLWWCYINAISLAWNRYVLMTVVMMHFCIVWRLFAAVLTGNTRNWAIANRLHVSCTHSTSRAPIVALQPWNLGYESLQIIGNGTIR